MTKQERDNIVGVTSLQTLIRSVELYVKSDGLEPPLINGLATQPLYDVLNMMCRVTFGTPVVNKNLRYGQQEALMSLQHWYNQIRSFVNQGNDYHLHPMEIDGEWDTETYMGLKSIVDCYRNHWNKKDCIAGTNVGRREYRISNLNQISFEIPEQVDAFHRIAESATGVVDVEQYIHYMQATGWSFSVGCTENGHPVGVIAYNLPNPMLGNKEVIIAGLFVDPLHRGRGIGKTLVDDVLRSASPFDYNVVANKSVGHVPGWQDVINFLSKFNVKM